MKLAKEVSRVDVSDEALYEKYLKQGDNEALQCLLERYREGLTLFLFGFVRNAQDAEELMLDAFAEIAVGPTIFSGKSSFKTWLFSVGKHLALKQLRRQKHAAVTYLSGAEASAQPELRLLQEEQNRALYAALEHITQEYREVLLLQYMENMTPAEIAQVMGKRVGQIYNLIKRGKQALRSELERMGFAYAEY